MEETMEEYIRDVIAPKLQGDGGWIDYISYEQGNLKVMLQGECSKCNIASRCMDWIKAEVKKDFGEEIQIIPIRKKPFFWDNTI